MTDRTLLTPARALVRQARQRAANLDMLHGPLLRLRSRQSRYRDAYTSQAWGSSESGSGTGSELRATENIRRELPGLLERLGVDSLLDAPCGDWNWMQHVNLPVSRYHGVDIVPHVIEENRRRFAGVGRSFEVADLAADPLPKADAILCRDTLVHVSYQDAFAMLRNFRATGAKWLLVNTYPEVRENKNQFTGARWRRLNLNLAPFRFPDCEYSIEDGGDVDPSLLCVWRLPGLPIP